MGLAQRGVRWKVLWEGREVEGIWKDDGSRKWNRRNEQRSLHVRHCLRLRHCIVPA